MTLLHRRAVGGALALLLMLVAASLLPLRAQQDAFSPASPQAPEPLAVQDGPPVDQVVHTVTPPMHEISPRTMFLSADWVVKSVMVGLAFASVLTWTIFIAKLIELLLMQRRLVTALHSVAHASSLREALGALSRHRTILRSYLTAAADEARLSSGIANDDGIKERAASSFAEITRAETGRIRFGMGLLATIASTSPFVGLFGTVWGIMNSFIGISKSHTTNLAVVAPGIAEALLATAVGLFAAIPAVIIYNHFSRVTRTYLALANRAAGISSRLLSRDLDRGVAAIARAAE